MSKEISHVDIPSLILHINDLNGHQKILLTLIGRFHKGKGLLLDNTSISQLLGISPRSASRLISGMEHKKYITTRNKQSRYRTCFICEKVGDAPNAKTKDILLLVEKWSCKGNVTRPDLVSTQPHLSTISIKKEKKNTSSENDGEDNILNFHQGDCQEDRLGAKPGDSEEFDYIPDPTPDQLAKWEEVCNG